MSFDLNRRDVLRFAAGAAAGVALSPAPWKAIDDVAIWTQNWSWIPTPPRGIATMQSTVCALCPSACPARARCIGSLPVSMHAAGMRPLCSLGLAAHHLPWHPARIRRAQRALRHGGTMRHQPESLTAVVDETARAIAAARDASRPVALLDMRPGRSVSWAWRHLLAGLPGGIAIPTPTAEGTALQTTDGSTGATATQWAADLAHARTVLSFGAPLAEGWGDADNLGRITRRDVRLLQVDPIRTPSAAAADRWLPARPGTDALLALAIGHVLVAERLARPAGDLADFDAYASLVAGLTPERASQATGVPAEEIIAAARELAAGAPALVVVDEGRGDAAARTAILALDVLLGSAGRAGGLLARAPLPEPFAEANAAPERELAEVADHSLALLLIDASAGDAALPWPLVERKLAPGARVVAISPFLAGSARHADLVIPAAPFLEAFLEVIAPPASPSSRLSTASPILGPSASVPDPATVIRSIAATAGIELAASWSSSTDLVRARVSRIHADGKGALVDPSGEVTRLDEVSSSDEVWEALLAGDTLQLDAATKQPAVTSLLGGHRDTLGRLRLGTPEASLARPLTLVARRSFDLHESAVVSPVLTKLYQESGLRRGPAVAVLNPRTAREIAVNAGAHARLETASGAMSVVVDVDHAVMPGVVAVETGPDPRDQGGATRAADALDLTPAKSGDAWGCAAARLVEG